MGERKLKKEQKWRAEGGSNSELRRPGYDLGVQVKVWKAKEKKKTNTPAQKDNRDNVKSVFCQNLFFLICHFFLYSSPVLQRQEVDQGKLPQ